VYVVKAVALLVVELHELQILRKAKLSSVMRVVLATVFLGGGGRDTEAVILVDLTLFVPVCFIVHKKYNYFQSITPIFYC